MSPFNARMGQASRGFTLIELGVVMMVVAILAAVLTPVVVTWIDEARVTRAAREAQTIADAVLAFYKNTGKWPIFQSGANITTTSAYYDILMSPGSMPTTSGGSDWLSASRLSLSNALEINSPGYTTLGRFAWRGPYLAAVGSDPWGYAYIVNGKSLRFGVNKAGFVLSAGPDGIIQTPFDQNIGSGSSAVTTGGDDIVARIR
jgi:prepilin-type N-terminal cleavage/methylation domain-containing protein